ncbi:hypothetical protein AMS68_004012 [Peltaster fructicola]|uniref:DNA repair protein REV1 n=1 Tax=Peltaster fructicola TaxID=286661 RepID=A0A6H0XV15_9PEZI|nr:hypothetical protein AMS68_004012 [Peltaster fructicola]
MGSRLEQKSNLVRKRIEQHTFDNETGDEYEGSKFGGFPEYFRRKKIKLQNLDAEVRAHSDKPAIFKGVVCHVNGYTQPSLKDLHTMIVEYGGGFIQYLDGKTMVTHIIASNLTPKKKDEFRRYRIVKPAWIVDSVVAGRLLPWDAYRVVDEGVGQKVLGFDNGKVVSQANRKSTGYREQTEASWYNQQLASSSAVTGGVAAIVPRAELIDDDGFTSSMERALLDGINTQDDFKVSEPPHDEPGQDEALSLHDTESPRSDIRPQPGREETAPIYDAGSFLPDELPPHEEPAQDNPPQLQPREGSQEPDYTMAVVANSEILKSIPPEKLAQMTAEEHNALLLSDPKIRKSTVVHPDFLEQYYRESRLHHLSTWKADLKSQLQALAAAKSSQKPKLKKLPGQRRYVMHVDFDSFFAAVSLKKYPQFVDKPAVVAHGGGSGSEIASCNYHAREFGVKNGMWMRRAQELCPTLNILPYDFPAYEEASRKFYDAIMATGGVVQSVSIDEALVDISALCFAESATDGVKRHEGAIYREQQKADDLAQGLRDEVLKQTGCAVSVGIGGNILQAKVALRHAKPAGQYQLKPEEVLDFMGKLEVQALPGIAWSIGSKLEDMGIKLVKDVRESTRERLITALGPKTGEKIWDYARGIDRVEVGDQVVRKSVSAEVNWGVRFENQEQVDEFMVGLCGELHKRLNKERVKGKQLTMKVMRRSADAPLDPPKHLGHGKCDTYNKSLQLGVATNDATIITKEATALMRSFGISPGELRGIGVQMQKLEPLKSVEQGQNLSSQKRLQFKLDTERAAAPQFTDAVREPPSDSKAPVTVSNKPSLALPVVKDATGPARPLNILGTQFVMPTQVDPKVLAELPEDIRTRLIKRGESSKGAEQDDSAGTTASLFNAELPSESQLDPEALEALPEDLRREVLAMYSPRKPKQAVLPQSPRKARSIPMPKLPTKRPRGGLRFGRSRAGDTSTLTQSNFVARPLAVSDRDSGRDSPGVEPVTDHVDEDFLAALPEDIRQEVLAQHRQQRLQRTGGIGTSMHQRPRALQKRPTKIAPRVFRLPSSSAKPTFTSRKLSTLPDLRSAINAWVDEFADEGPIEDDVAALEKYLRQVVSEELNLDKAVAVVKWLAWVLDERAVTTEFCHSEWEASLKAVQEGVQQAAQQRGIGVLDLG